jgi:phospholipid/cholesterol/gamma-HCH transport system permease protein
MNGFAVTGAADATLILSVEGDWSIAQKLPSLHPIRESFGQSPAVRRLRFVASDLGKWDSALLTFLLMVESLCRNRGISVDSTDLPAGIRKLMALALTAVPHIPAAKTPAPLLARIGTSTIRRSSDLLGAVTFLGESLIAFARFLGGRARYRPTDLVITIRECGADALPIVSIIALLVGMIFAFVGALQLRQFGADIYDANLVAVAMSREMAAVMTAIVLSGRTGAAFAAQIAAMQGNEEIDALSTLGISPIEFLVLPRMLALILMTPLLCIYANALGLIGGFLVGIATLNVTPTAYILQTQGAVTLTDFSIGIVKAAVFGALIAVAGCRKGIEAGRSAAAVGAAATSAVVLGILAVIVTDAAFSVILSILGI